jgi:hypothetical protein
MHRGLWEEDVILQVATGSCPAFPHHASNLSLSLWAPTPSLVAVHGVLVAARTAEQRWSATPAGPRGKGGEGRLYWREERTGDRGGGREPVGGGVEDASEWSARATFMAGG